MPTKSRSKFSKFYFPGMISLVCIPLLCIYLFFCKKSQQLGRLEFITISKQELLESNKLRYPIYSIFTAKRIYSDLVFSGNQMHDDNVRKDLQLTIKQLITKKDTINGVIAELGTHSKYADLVNIVDLCHRPENHNIVFAFYNDRFYIKYMTFDNIIEDNPNPKGMPL